MKKAQKKAKTEKPAVSEKKKISRARGPCGPGVCAGESYQNRLIPYMHDALRRANPLPTPLLSHLTPSPVQYSTPPKRPEKRSCSREQADEGEKNWQEGEHALSPPRLPGGRPYSAATYSVPPLPSSSPFSLPRPLIALPFVARRRVHPPIFFSFLFFLRDDLGKAGRNDPHSPRLFSFWEILALSLRTTTCSLVAL